MQRMYHVLLTTPNDCWNLALPTYHIAGIAVLFIAPYNQAPVLC